VTLLAPCPFLPVTRHGGVMSASHLPALSRPRTAVARHVVGFSACL
jgi:hypothetical protein